MECKKPAAVILAGAFVANAVGAGYGIQLFTDLPPLAAVTLASTASAFTGVTNTPIYIAPRYDTVTDQRIEMPTSEKDRTEQS
jgi:hypothetical protein